MRLILLTQDDPFYLGASIQNLLDLIDDEVVACVISSSNPYGKPRSLYERATSVWKTFGIRFFTYYLFQYLLMKSLRRQSRVRSIMKRHAIPVIVPRGSINDAKIIGQLKAYSPDLLISIGSPEIFRRPLLDLAPKGCLNLHTALLPKYRGLLPSFWVLKNDEKKTGVSVFFVDERIDSGPILVQKAIEIGDMTHRELIRHSKRIGMQAVSEAVSKIKSGVFETLPNDDAEMTYFSFPTHEDVKVFREKGKRFF